MHNLEDALLKNLYKKIAFKDDTIFYNSFQ